MDQHILDDIHPTRWPATFVASTLLLGTVESNTTYAGITNCWI